MGVQPNIQESVNETSLEKQAGLSNLVRMVFHVTALSEQERGGKMRNPSIGRRINRKTSIVPLRFSQIVEINDT